MSRDETEDYRGDSTPARPVWSDEPGGAAATDPSADGTRPPELDALPDHEVIRRLDKGGMGAVYLVRHRLLGRLEALKVIQPHLPNRPDLVERFLREIRAGGSLDHANIVPAYAAMKTPCGLVFTMKYVEGENLRRVVENEGPLPVPTACDYAIQAARGLQHAHERGFVHRDIKPANLILDADGVVRILDFGLAKAVREHESAMDLTWPNQTLGTPAFLAPEQSLDPRNADIRADIYSLGCTLYYLLSGAPPFEAPSLAALLEAHRSSTARPLDRVRADVPAGLADVVARMMAKDPDVRQATPAEVVQALAPFAEPGNAGIGPELPIPSPPLAGLIRLLRTGKLVAPGVSGKRRHAGTGVRSPMAWISLTGGLALVTILAALGLSGARQASPTNQRAVAYNCECDVYVTERGGKRLANRAVLGGILDSLRRDDLVHVVARLPGQQAAYFYVLQIDSRGRAKALFPEDWGPRHLPAAESERADLRIPTTGDMPVDREAPPGLEALICFARSEPLTREDNDLLWDLCTGKDFAWAQPTEFEEVFVSFVDGEQTTRRGFDPSRSATRKDPISQAERILLMLKAKGVAAHSRGICYPLAAPGAAGTESGGDGS